MQSRMVRLHDRAVCFREEMPRGRYLARCLPDRRPGCRLLTHLPVRTWPKMTGSNSSKRVLSRHLHPQFRNLEDRVSIDRPLDLHHRETLSSNTPRLLDRHQDLQGGGLHTLLGQLQIPHARIQMELAMVNIPQHPKQLLTPGVPFNHLRIIRLLRHHETEQLRNPLRARARLRDLHQHLYLGLHHPCQP